MMTVIPKNILDLIIKQMVCKDLENSEDSRKQGFTNITPGERLWFPISMDTSDGAAPGRAHRPLPFSPPACISTKHVTPHPWMRPGSVSWLLPLPYPPQFPADAMSPSSPLSPKTLSLTELCCPAPSPVKSILCKVR